jgi:hypothetical protein
MKASSFLPAGLLAAGALSASVSVSAGVSIGVSGGSAPTATPQCKCFPGDSCWPSTSEWKALNQTVGGRLIATVPLGHPCHDPTYDGAECQALRDAWQNPSIQ